MFPKDLIGVMCKSNPFTCNKNIEITHVEHTFTNGRVDVKIAGREDTIDYRALLFAWSLNDTDEQTYYVPYAIFATLFDHAVDQPYWITLKDGERVKVHAVFDQRDRINPVDIGLGCTVMKSVMVEKYLVCNEYPFDRGQTWSTVSQDDLMNGIVL